MKKVSVFMLLLTLILAVTTNVSASNSTGKWEEYIGINFYNFDEDEAGDDSSEGFLIGARKWSNERLAFGGEWDYTSYGVDGTDVTLNGFLGTFTYKLLDNFSLDGALGIYRGKFENGGSSDSENDLGARIGLESKLPLTDNMALIGRTAYRFLKIEDVDFSGLEFSLALTNKF